MKIVLDTNRYSDVDRGEPDASEFIRLVDEIGVPTIVLGELRSGFLNGSKPDENERRLLKFLSLSRVKVLLPDEATSHEYARLFVQLRRIGKMIPTNDIWIAALTVQHSLALYSRDQHFDLLPQLSRA